MKSKHWPILLAALIALAPIAATAQGAEAPEEMTGNINVGDKVPSFTLKDQNGEERTLKSLLEGEGLTALVFYRSANW